MIDFTLLYPSLGSPNIIKRNENTYELKYPCYSNNKCSPYIAELFPGNYSFEVYGAKGGGNTDDKGNGGYSHIYYYLKRQNPVYVSLGGMGTKSSSTNIDETGGYNGGGKGGYDSGSIAHNSGGGGGASDIRIGRDDYDSRIIIAGGGGGGNICIGENGGSGGGINGENAPGSSDSNYQPGGGASQLNGGSSKNQNGATSGSKFQGGNGSSGLNTPAGGGGGGGYFGGGGGWNGLTRGCAPSGGGGGSGFIGADPTGLGFTKGIVSNSNVNNGQGYAIITVIKLALSHIYVKQISCHQFLDLRVLTLCYQVLLTYDT